MSSTSSSQRFCLRWNNHQSNLLSVFDQLLHDESFVDVTLAVEGQLLKAHKMILSACSPYFQTLFVGHPDKHPIVILKDVPYADMRSLLDFMYRGEVSVDQDRLTAFLKVAESLRIKGLTEVNEERCDIPSIASSLLHSSPTPTNHHPPPHLHRIHHGGGKRGLPPMAANPLLGSALTAPKRKRGRPRKLSGGGGGDRMDRGDSEQLDHQEVNQLVTQKGGNEGNSPPHNRSDSPLLHHATQPELLEVNMSEYPALAPPPPPPPPPTSPPPSSSPPPPPPPPTTGNATTRQRDDDDDDDLPATAADHHHLSNITIKEEQMEPGPSTSINDTSRDFKPGSQDGERFMTPDIPPLRLVPHAELMSTWADFNDESKPPPPTKGKKTGNKMSGGGIVKNETGSPRDTDNNNDYLSMSDSERMKGTPSPSSRDGGAGLSYSEPPPARPATTRRRIRRRATSSSDPAEALTEMSVRGLNLFRYASLSEGIYKCMECAKSDILKTFKNKYSFQRHAFLYHEGHQRKVFPCPVCSKEFSRPDKMKNHMKTVHDCFMPKDCVFPGVNFFLPSGVSPDGC